jgi:hypothetical protein
MGSPTAEDIWGSSEASRVQALPEDVRLWLTNILEPGEPVVFSLLADIAPGGEFRENWAFLTDRRVLVLTRSGRSTRLSCASTSAAAHSS